MSAPMSQKEIRVLIKHLQDQGLVFTRSTKGYRAPLPDVPGREGQFLTIHTTNSDHRSTENMRARVRQHGLTWPTDKQLAVKEPWEADLPTYLSGGAPRAATIQRVSDAIDKIRVNNADPWITAKAVVDTAGMGTNLQGTYRSMIHLGWIPTEDKAGRERKWIRQPEVDNVELVADENDELPEVPKDHEQGKKSTSSPERIVLDSVDSWTLHLNLTNMQDLTLKELRATMLATGLHMEIRVWRGAVPRFTPSESSDNGKGEGNGGSK